MPKENKTDFEKYLSTFKNDLENLIRKVNGPGTVVSGFILNKNPNCLIRFGNNGNKGADLIRLHLALASFAADIESMPNLPPGIGYADVGEGNETGESDTDIAYQLAKAVLVSGMEPEYASKALALAERYVALHKGK